jgi:hypothetical protein
MGKKSFISSEGHISAGMYLTLNQKSEWEGGVNMWNLMTQERYPYHNIGTNCTYKLQSMRDTQPAYKYRNSKISVVDN